MKKSLIVTLALVFVLGIAGTAFAAANPFVDVPAKHWAYDAVSKLAQAGVVDGYGDGTFRGDKTITRYEMAQIVAKAMTRSDKQNAETKALVDKLAVEFSAELNNLGVRVAKLEAKTNVGLTYESRIRYGGDDNKAITGTSQADWRQRIYLAGKVNDNVTYGARLEAGNYLSGQPQNDTVKDAGGNTNGTTPSFNRAFFSIKDFAGLDNLTVGRFATLGATNGLLNAKTSNNDGFVVTKKLGDEVTFKTWYTNQAKNSEVILYNFDVKPSQDFGFNVGYQTTNLSYKANLVDELATEVKTTSVDVGAWAKMGSFFVTGEYVNTKDKIADNATRKAYALQVTNGVTPAFYGTYNIVNPVKAHTDAFSLSYRSIEPNATPTMSTFAGSAPVISTVAADNNVKGYFFTYQNVVSKGVIWTVEYQDLKEKVATEADGKDKVWNTSFQFFF